MESSRGGNSSAAGREAVLASGPVGAEGHDSQASGEKSVTEIGRERLRRNGGAIAAMRSVIFAPLPVSVEAEITLGFIPALDRAIAREQGPRQRRPDPQ